jgi:hypothetical protein
MKVKICTDLVPAFTEWSIPANVMVIIKPRPTCTATGPMLTPLAFCMFTQQQGPYDLFTGSAILFSCFEAASRTRGQVENTHLSIPGWEEVTKCSLEQPTTRPVSTGPFHQSAARALSQLDGRFHIMATFSFMIKAVKQMLPSKHWHGICRLDMGVPS